MAWTYVGGTTGTGTAASNSVSLTGLTGGIASSPAENDLVVVFAGFGNTAASAPTISGNSSGAYSSAITAQHANDTWDTEFGVFYKVMGATPDTSLTFGRTNNAAYGGAVAVHVWRGVDTASPFIGAATPATGNNGNRVDPPSYNPAVAGALVIGGGAGTFATADTAGYTSWGSVLTNTVVAYGNGSTSDTGVIIGSAEYAGAAIDPPIATGGNTSTSASWAAATVAFRQAPVRVTNDYSDSYTVSSGVTSGYSDAYTLNGRIGANYADSYTVNARVASSFSDSYTVLSRVGANLSDAYTVNARVTSSLADSYTVTGRIAGSYSDAYTLSELVRAFVSWVEFDVANAPSLARVSSDLADSYVLNGHVGANYADSYTVRVSVAQPYSDAYTVSTFVGASFSDAYSLSVRVSKDLVDAFGLNGHVTSAYADAYTVTGRIGQNYSDAYTVWSRLAQAFTDAYMVVGRIGASLADAYVITGRISADLADQYSLGQAFYRVSNDYTDAYALSVRVSGDLTDAYTVSVRVQSSAGDAYVISARVAQSYADAYAVSGRVAQTFDDAYTVFVRVYQDYTDGFDLTLATEFALPMEDLATGAWKPSLNGSPLYAMVDEATPDLNDYIFVEEANSTAELKLTGVLPILPDAGHAVQFYAKGTPGRTLQIHLMQGTTEIGSWDQVLTATPTLYDLPLSAAQIAAISNYNDLRFRLVGA